jgi:hypothetical protein
MVLLAECFIMANHPDLDLLTIGMVMDIRTEKGNYSTTYDNMATHEDFNPIYY